jgi:hypothetical protein
LAATPASPLRYIQITALEFFGLCPHADFYGSSGNSGKVRPSFIKPATVRDGGKGRYASLCDGQRPPLTAVADSGLPMVGRLGKVALSGLSRKSFKESQ